MRRIVAITGVGAVTPLGQGMVPTWEALVAGRSALGKVTRLDTSGFPASLGAEIADLSAKDHMPKAYRKAIKVMARDTEIAVAAARLAADDAGLVTRFHAEAGQTTPTYAAGRLACQIGAGLIAADTAELAAAMATARDAGATAEQRERNNGFSLRAWGTEGGPEAGAGGGMNNLPPLWMLKYLPNMLACHVSIIHGCEGPSNTHTCGEASGLLSLGESARVIERDAADAAIAGGAESKLNLMGVLRLCAGGFLAHDAPGMAGPDVVRPFDSGATGTLVGEGGALLVLEHEAAARARGARVYATIAGFGAAQSPHSPMMAGADGGATAQAVSAAVRAAMRDAGVTHAEIDAVAPLGCGVRAFDTAEAAGLTIALGHRVETIPAITLSPNMGNLYAGHASVQVAAAAMALHRQQLPARVHAGSPEGLQAGASGARACELRHVLVTAVSIAGQCAAMVVRRANPA